MHFSMLNTASGLHRSSATGPVIGVGASQSGVSSYLARVGGHEEGEEAGADADASDDKECESPALHPVRPLAADAGRKKAPRHSPCAVARV